MKPPHRIFAAMQLIALPFAGGNETSYERFRPYLPEGWELVTLHQPGKGSRIREQPLTDIHAIVEGFLGQVLERVGGHYVLYGHSMGAMLAYLLIHRLAEAGGPLPRRLFISSFPAPSHHHDRHRGRMTDAEFIAHMRTLGGLPPALLAQPKLMSVFLPVLRADITAIDGYRHHARQPFDVPITAVFGSQETALVGSVRDWQQETTQPLALMRMDGGHFFIFEQAERLVGLMVGEAGG